MSGSDGSNMLGVDSDGLTETCSGFMEGFIDNTVQDADFAKVFFRKGRTDRASLENSCDIRISLDDDDRSNDFFNDNLNGNNINGITNNRNRQSRGAGSGKPPAPLQIENTKPPINSLGMPCGNNNLHDTSSTYFMQAFMEENVQDDDIAREYMERARAERTSFLITNDNGSVIRLKSPSSSDGSDDLEKDFHFKVQEYVGGIIRSVIEQSNMGDISTNKISEKLCTKLVALNCNKTVVNTTEKVLNELLNTENHPEPTDRNLTTVERMRKNVSSSCFCIVI